MNPLKKARIPSNIRNKDEAAKDAKILAKWPTHTRKPIIVENIHETFKDTRVLDPY